jgi:signal transduction histidine kinase
MKKYLLLLAFLLFLSHSYGQKDSLPAVLFSDSVESTLFLGPYLHVFADSTGKLGPGDLQEGWFRKYSNRVRKHISKRVMSEGYVWFRFHIQSAQTDTSSYYITSGPLTREITLYQRAIGATQWTEVRQQQPIQAAKAYARLSIAGTSETEILGRVRFAKTNVSLFSPYIINDAYLRYHQSFLHNHWYGLNTVTYLLVGALLMMLIFSFGSFLQNGKKEFLFYSLYALSLGALLYLKAVTFNKAEEFTFFNEEYLDYLLLMAGYVFYISFSRIFLNTRSEMPFLNRLLLGAEFIVLLFLLLFTLFYFSGNNYDLLNNLENASKYFMIFVGLCFVVLGIIKRNRIWNYLMAGNIANLFMAGFSQYMIIFPSTNLVPDNGLFRQSLFYFELGILLEMFLFLAGLNYKNKIELIEKVKMKEALKQEGERKEYEKQIAVLSAQQEERSRISADMHDELGSGVTAIRLLSELARKKTKDQPLEELTKISFNANDLMVKMNGIIWSMNPGS